MYLKNIFKFITVRVIIIIIIMNFNLILSAYCISKPGVSSASSNFIFIVIINKLVLTF